MSIENESVRTEKSDWFRRFMLFLLVIVVAVSLGLMIFYFAQDGESIKIKKADTQVNATESFSVEIEQTRYNGSTKITPEFDESVFSIKDDLKKVVTKGKKRTTTFVFETKNNNEGTYEIKFKTNSKDKKSKEMSVQVCVANGEEIPYFIAEAKNLVSIGTNGGFGSEKNYQLTDNIDLKDYPNWTPISNLVGTFDGNGKTISNLKITAQGTNTAFGLFGVIQGSGVVKNLRILDAQILGAPTQNSNIGVVAGECFGKIERVLIESSSSDSAFIKIGDVDGDGKIGDTSAKVNVGSVVGLLKRNSANSIHMVDRVGVSDNFSVKVLSNNESYVGGIVGLVKSGTIINSYERGNVSAGGSQVCLGGIAGKVSAEVLPADSNTPVTTSMKGNIVNCYTTSKAQKIGAIINSMGAVIGANENIGTMTQKSPRKYTPNTVLTNNVDKFDGVSSIHENRYVGVYYLYKNDLAWAPGYTQSWAPEVEAEDDKTYYLVTGLTETSSFGQGLTYTFSGSERQWDFNNIWTWNGTGEIRLPKLLMKDYNYSLNVYDPQSSYSGEIVTPSSNTHDPEENQSSTTPAPTQQTDSDTQQITSFDDIKNMNGAIPLSRDITISNSDHFEPFVLKATIVGNGHKIIITDTNFKGFFTKIAAGAEICDVIIIASFDNVTKNTSISSSSFGLIAYENEGTISNVTFKNNNGSLKLSGEKTSAKAIGLMVGLNKGTIENSKVENSTITLKDFNSETYVGAIAGRNLGQIQDCEVVSSTSISATESSGIIYAGLVAGAGENNSSINGAKVSGDITLKTNASNYASGIIAKMINKATAQNVLFKSGTVKANMAAGICSSMYVTEMNSTKSANAVNVAQVNKGVTLEGKMVGGLFGIMDRGIAKNCAVYAKLKTVDNESVIAGFAYQMNGSGKVSDHEMAELYTSFASSNLDVTKGGAAYNETTSDVRNQNKNGNFIDWVWGGWNDVMGAAPDNPTDGKTAGYICDSYFNGDVMQGINATPSGNNNRVISKLSSADCKQSSKFTNFDFTNVWTLSDMPVLKSLNNL